MATSGAVVAAPPTDGISSISFSKQLSDFLYSSSWEGAVRVYHGVSLKNRIEFNSACITLATCYSGEKVSVGCLDGSLNVLDVETGAVGSKCIFNNGVSCVDVNDVNNIIYAGSWDGTVKCVDDRGSEQPSSIEAGNKVYSISTSGFRLIIATSGRAVQVYDVRNTSGPVQTRESPLRCQTRKVVCRPDQSGFAVGSIEGRVAMEFFEADRQADKYAFKCHRKDDRAFPVNAICFHPVSTGTFATGGSDGTVCTWDGDHRKKLANLGNYPASVSSLSFSKSGEHLAVASSYIFEEGDKVDSPKSEIFIRNIDWSEVRPRSQK